MDVQTQGTFSYNYISLLVPYLTHFLAFNSLLIMQTFISFEDIQILTMLYIIVALFTSIPDVATELYQFGHDALPNLMNLTRIC